MTSMTDALNNTERYETNLNKQVVKKIQKDGTIYKYNYDRAKRLINTIDPMNYRINIEYSLGDDVLKTTDTLGRQVNYENYWTVGRQVVMCKLETIFSEKEKRILEPYKKDVIILEQLEFECFEIAYDKKGEYSFEECFGEQEDLKEKEMRYNRIIPKRAIKIYQYYLIETYDEPEIWHQGEVENNGNVEFYAKIESLEYALQSL